MRPYGCKPGSMCSACPMFVGRVSCCCCMLPCMRGSCKANLATKQTLSPVTFSANAADSHCPDCTCEWLVGHCRHANTHTCQSALWLVQIDSWEFDIFQLSNLTNGRPLYTLCMTLMEREGLLVMPSPLLTVSRPVLAVLCTPVKVAQLPFIYSLLPL